MIMPATARGALLAGALMLTSKTGLAQDATDAPDMLAVQQDCTAFIIVGVDGRQFPVPDGTYTTADGHRLTIKDGAVPDCGPDDIGQHELATGTRLQWK